MRYQLYEDQTAAYSPYSHKQIQAPCVSLYQQLVQWPCFLLTRVCEILAHINPPVYIQLRNQGYLVPSTKLVFSSPQSPGEERQKNQQGTLSPLQNTR